MKYDLYNIKKRKSSESLFNEKNMNHIDKNLLNGQRVLLVDDNEFNRMVAISLLKQWNIITEEAENGKVALEKLATTHHDLILMDIQMPVMDGIEATGYIRQTMKLEVPIIALTANAITSDKDKYLACGMNDCISKPFNPPELFATISRVLNLAPPISKSNLIVEALNSNTKKLYDLSGLKTIASGDEAFFTRMISLFLSQSEEYIQKIHEFSQSGNLEQIKVVVHKMKPSVRTLGITDIKLIIEKIEMMNNIPENLVELSLYTEKLESTLKEVCEQLKFEFPQD
jgi:CheY-like chemotaxis protein/HPt (histidine-containing phosphotransfer) domain-containing protein